MIEPATDRPRMPPLNALRAFDAVARLGSLRKAAAELCVAHTVVSRHVRNLEAAVGVRLLLLSPTGAFLSNDGLRFHERVSTGFRLIEQATADIRPGGHGGELRLCCAPSLTSRWLLPKLNELAQLVPGRGIVLRSEASALDFSRRQIDIALLYDAQALPKVRTIAVHTPRMFPVASPDYLREHEPIDSLEKLACADLLHFDGREHWRTWFNAAGLDRLGYLGGPQIWQYDVAIEAALRGHGIALTNQAIVGRYLQSGELVEILDTNFTFGPFTVQALEERWQDPVIIKIVRWLRQQFDALPSYNEPNAELKTP